MNLQDIVHDVRQRVLARLRQEAGLQEAHSVKLAANYLARAYVDGVVADAGVNFVQGAGGPVQLCHSFPGRCATSLVILKRIAENQPARAGHWGSVEPAC